MVKTILNLCVVAVFSLAVASCTASDDPISLDGGQTTTPDDSGNTGENQEEEDSTPQTLLAADGNSANTYNLIYDAGYGCESPDECGTHTEFQHIDQRYDSALGKYIFDFYIHIDEDDDRGYTTITDRQRNEIKTDGKSPDHLVAYDGDMVEYHWYMLLPEGMLTTTLFCHIHQIKGIDNSEGTADVSNPVITFTVRTKSSAQQFEVRYYAPTADNADVAYLGSFALSEMLGEWVEVTERITYKTDGSYSLSIKRVSDSKELLSIPATTLKTTRDGAPAMRPKWGIYRSFGEAGANKYQLRDEVLGFADFSIVKL